MWSRVDFFIIYNTHTYAHVHVYMCLDMYTYIRAHVYVCVRCVCVFCVSSDGEGNGDERKTSR